MEAQAFYALSGALAISLGALGGTFAQGKAAAAALEGIARNPGAQQKIFVPMILALALIESLVILSFVVANSLVGKL
jgi:F-type H+-transporting ATPase subunit c